MFEASDLKLNIVTAISNSETEEEISALLYSQGCNIIYRALTLDLLMAFLEENTQIITILYSPDLIIVKELNKLIARFTQHRFIKVDLINYQPTQLLIELAQTSRPVMMHKVVRQNNLYTIMGSPGSPGTSTIANHLAIYIDATIISANHHNLRPVSEKNVYKVNAEQLMEKLQPLSTQQVIIDAGSAVSLTDTLADRRVNAHWLSQSIACCSHLIYLVKANEDGITYLTEFKKDFTNLINPPKIIYLLNQQRFDRLGQMIQKQFIALVSKEISVQIPYDRRLGRVINGSKNWQYFWHNNAFNKQIGKIGNQLVQ